MSRKSYFDNYGFLSSPYDFQVGWLVRVRVKVGARLINPSRFWLLVRVRDKKNKSHVINSETI